ncbi:sulfurtransferase [Komagataeibacter diospyri]|uniref:sulfurtransferase n=1 Tax=Komagataeibacter diospyri TaxID=1932662 RepID=UPI003756E013
MTHTTNSDLPLLVPVDWLMSRLESPDLVILDARVVRQVETDGSVTYQPGEACFQHGGHIPGARFADLFNGFSAPSARFAFTCPGITQLGITARKLGLHPHNRIVIYDALTGAWAARIWWILRVYGHQNVAVLNGGLTEWQKQGGSLEYGIPADPKTGSWIPTPIAPRSFTSFPEVVDIVQGRRPAHLICALTITNSNSDAHCAPIPGSYNLPYRGLLDDAGKLDPTAIRRETERLNLKKDDDIVLYCGGGINAAGLALGLELEGFRHIGIFDGSLEEWHARTGLHST